MIAAIVTDSLGLEEVSNDSPLMSSGMNSRGANALRQHLNEKLAMELPGTFAFDYPSISTIAGFVSIFIDPRAASPSLEATQPQSTRAESAAAGSAPLYLSTLASRLPVATAGNSTYGLGSLEGGDICGTSLVAPIDSDAPRVLTCSRSDGCDLQQVYSGMQQAVQFGAIVPDVALIDASQFAITGSEAASMDPQQRLLLEGAQETLGRTFKRSAVGIPVAVMVGIVNVDYMRLVLKVNDQGVVSAYTAAGLALGVASGRISFAFGLSGPAASIDTACSSALVAVHSSASAMDNNECISALCGGVNLTLTPATTMLFNRSGMMAQDGRCKTLDSRADGYVRAEAMVMLQLGFWVADASADADASKSDEHATARLSASVINQDGPSSALTAPNGPSQMSAISRGLYVAGGKVADVINIQMHGTGTALGDPIELNAITAVLVAPRQKKDAQPLKFSALKSALGHGEAVAGTLGLLQTWRLLSCWQILAIIHLQAVNQHVAFSLASAASADKSTVDRIAAMLIVKQHSFSATLAGTSSFGFSGTNAHAILSPKFPVSDPWAPRLPWQRFRQWITPSTNWLLHQAMLGTTDSSTISRIEAQLWGLRAPTSGIMSWQGGRSRPVHRFLRSHWAPGGSCNATTTVVTCWCWHPSVSPRQCCCHRRTSSPLPNVSFAVCCDWARRWCRQWVRVVHQPPTWRGDTADSNMAKAKRTRPAQTQVATPSLGVGKGGAPRIHIIRCLATRIMPSWLTEPLSAMALPSRSWAGSSAVDMGRRAARLASSTSSISRASLGTMFILDYRMAACKWA